MNKRSSRGNRRNIGTRPPRKVIYVCTEGKVTERKYLMGYERELGQAASAHFVMGHCESNPYKLIELARRELAQQKKSRGNRYDEFWCVFDFDEYFESPHELNELVSSARKAGLEAAVSNPCFELWLVLHCRDWTAHVERGDIQRHASQLKLTDRKAIINSAWDALVTCYEQAKQRAQRLDAKHRGDGSPPRTNPSTDVWRLVDCVRPLA